MGKIFVLVMIVVGIWAGMTIYTEGTDRAFGGLFAGDPSVEGSGEPSSPLLAVEGRAAAARDAQVERIERQVQ